MLRQAWLRRPIMEDVDIADAAKALFEAPFGVLAHRLPEAGEEQSEPTFVYANQVVLSFARNTPQIDFSKVQ